MSGVFYNRPAGGRRPKPYAGGVGAATRTTVGDTNYTIKSWDRFVALTATLTGVRSWTLPPAASVPPGYPIIVYDEVGGISNVNTLTLLRQGSDTINSGSFVTLDREFGLLRVVSDGIINWGYDPALIGLFSGTLRTSSSIYPLGYEVGAGGEVTQATSKSTAVTIATPTGRINTHNASLAAGASVEFRVNNSRVVIQGDTVTANLASNDGPNYRIEVIRVATGFFEIRLTNITAGALGDVLLINFNVIKGAIN